MSRDINMPSTPGGAGRPASPAPTLQDHLQAAQAQPLGAGPANANPASPDTPDATAQSAPENVTARLRELEQENERLKVSHDRMRGQVSQRHKAEEEAQARADQAQQEMIQSQQQLAQAMSAMAQAQQPDPMALTEDDLAQFGNDNVSIVDKIVNSRVAALEQKYADLDSRVASNTQNVTESGEPMSEEKVRLITAQQTMNVHPDVVRARAHPQFTQFIESPSVDMPGSTYTQLAQAYWDFGQGDAFVNIHSRFLEKHDPQPGGNNPYPGMVPPANGARPDMTMPAGAGGGNAVPLHLQPDFQDKLQRGEVTYEDFIKSREQHTKERPPMPNGAGNTQWVQP